MSEVTHIHPEDFIEQLESAERLGVYKTLSWICFEFQDDMTTKDIVDPVHYGIGAIGEQLCNDFQRKQCLDFSLKEIIEKRKKQEKEEVKAE